jgi:hypothetical protein
LGLARPAPTHTTLVWPCCIVGGCEVLARRRHAVLAVAEEQQLEGVL